MKIFRIFTICLFCFGLVACDNKQELLSDKVYFFYQESCPHCHNAKEYIDNNYPNLKMEELDIAEHNARELFIKCAKKFNLENRLGTPLFCMDNNYIMGWSKRNEKKFERLVKPFLNH